MSDSRYIAGCAGQFVLSQGLVPFDDRNEAIVYAGTAGPLGCEVYDQQAKQWIGPMCVEDVEDARRALAAVPASGRSGATATGGVSGPSAIKNNPQDRP